MLKHTEVGDSQAWESDTGADAPLPEDLLQVLDPGDPSPVAIIRKGGAENTSDTATVYTGLIHAAGRLREIPLEGEDVLAIIPFHQIKERGFEALEGEEELLYLQSTKKWEVPVKTLLTVLPKTQPTIEDGGFDLSDEAYADLVRDVIDVEIGGGQCANFVLRRTYHAHTTTPRKEALLAWFAALLTQESGAYWTFVFASTQVGAVGASPERHVSASSGRVLMNPISGTMRHGANPPTEQEALSFLSDRKESEELVMVVDEELKMMSAVCPDGGVMRGPFLKPMSRVTHTEYLLEGRSRLDPREILRLTMFAPTVVGSPMGAAARVIAEYEGSPRGYYSGVLALFEERGGVYDLDAPILIRTAFLDEDGNVSVSAGATLVRHSDPLGEAKETHAKVSGVAKALGLKGLGDEDATPAAPGPSPAAHLLESRVIQEALDARNQGLAPFWRDEQTPQGTVAASVLVVDLGDDFAVMLAHQLRHLGVACRVVDLESVRGDEPEDLFIFGSGAGDPREDTAKVARLKELMAARLEAGKPMVATSLSHLVLAQMAGLPVLPLEESYQGVALPIPLLGEEALIGFYATFGALGKDGETTPDLNLTITSDPETGLVSSLRGDGLVSVAGHLESALSKDGFGALRRVVVDALASK